ncbi:glycosyltransferase [Aureibaculum luteum]|uniref:glycosyltransferase n=1 Tax=Aureibaculum luteum TaxID=1548456 RepID=UPI000E506038|nr:glycosyltransferase [Aureibaculum luteum]
MKKKLLIIANSTTYHQAPRGIQANRIIAYLAGIVNVFLITSNKSIPDHNDYFDKKIKFIYVLKQSSNNYFRFQQFFLGFLGSFDFFFMIKSYRKARKILKQNKIDIVVTHSVKISNAFTGALLKLRLGNNIKVISFYSDPFSFNNYINNLGFKKRIVLKLEKFLFKNQDIIVFPSKIMVQRYQELYPEYFHKFRHIPHSYIKNNDSRDSEIIKSRIKNKKIIISYIGSLNNIRNPIFILDYIEKNISFFKGNIRFEFVGPKSRDLLDDYSKRKGIHDIVKYIPKINVKKAEELAMASDILLLMDANVDRSPYLPSKLVDYLSYNTPIIGFSNKNGESYRVLKESKHFPLEFIEIYKLKDLINEILSNYNKWDFESLDYDINNVGDSWLKILN